MNHSDQNQNEQFFNSSISPNLKRFIAGLTLVAVFLTAHSCAQAQEAEQAPRGILGLHSATLHWEHGLNPSNPGLYYISTNGLTFGAYRNSYFKPSFYAGLTVETDSRRFAVSLAVVTGYEHHNKPFKGPLTPFLNPSYRLPVGEYGALRFSLPNFQGIHLSLERDL